MAYFMMRMLRTSAQNHPIKSIYLIIISDPNPFVRCNNNFFELQRRLR